MNFKLETCAGLSLILLVAGCASVLDLNDKRVLSDDEYAYYLETGEIPTEDELAAYLDLRGDGDYTDPTNPYGEDREPPGTGEGMNGTGGFGSVGDPGVGGTGSEVGYYDRPDPRWADLGPSNFDPGDEEYLFINAQLKSSRLNGYARPLYAEADGYPLEFMPEQSMAPYCMWGETYSTSGRGVISVSPNETTPLVFDDWNPVGIGLMVDATSMDGLPLLVELYVNADPGDYGTRYCQFLPPERPAFLDYYAFEENCDTQGGELYDPSIPFQMITITPATEIFGPGPFNFCLWGLAEVD